MRRDADRKRHRAFRSTQFRGFDCARDRRGVPRDHHLPGRVEVHRLDDLTLRRLMAGGGKFRVVEAEDGCHRAFTERHRALHRLATEPDKVHRHAKIESLRTHERRVFAQAMARHGHRHGSATLQPHAPGGHPSGKHGGLSLFGGPEFRFRPLLAQRPEVVAENARGLVEGLTDYRLGRREGRKHPDGLGALPRKHECQRHGRSRC